MNHDDYSNLDRRLVRLEESSVRQMEAQERMERMLNDAINRRQPQWGTIFTGVSVFVTIMGGVLLGFWQPLAAESKRLDANISAIQDSLIEVKSNRWSDEDQKSFDRDMTEWQRRQDDAILDLYRREADLKSELKK